MEEKKIDSKESIELIARMISNTRRRLCLGDGDIMLMWGYLTVSVSALVWVLLLLTHNQAVNWLWFLIWIVGGCAMPVMLRKKRTESGVVTYSDKISSGVWQIFGYSMLGTVALCLGFLLVGGLDAWRVMLLVALLGVGYAEAVQGVIIRERAMVFGGAVGIAAGMVTACCIAAGVLLYVNWYLPMFIVAFVCMMIVPGHILNHKARRENERA